MIIFLLSLSILKCLKTLTQACINTQKQTSNHTHTFNQNFNHCTTDKVVLNYHARVDFSSLSISMLIHLFIFKNLLYLQREGFPITDDTSQLNNCLHARDSSLNFSKNEVFLCFWQQQIMHTASFLPRATIISQQVTHVLIHQFCDEWNKRSLKTQTTISLGFIQSQVSTTENITKIQIGTVHFGNCFNNLLNKDVKYMQEVIFDRH